MPQLDDHGAGTVGGVGGPLAHLLEQNYAILNQFKQNMAAYKVNENTELLVRFRDNILTVLNHMNSMQVCHTVQVGCCSTKARCCYSRVACWCNTRSGCRNTRAAHCNTGSLAMTL
jgi:hypothetical protein